jgi:flagellar hook-length control protein FliK
MTTLGIIDLLDARGPRLPGSASSSRNVTPGAAAFADVIQDASRASAEDTDGAPSGTTTDDASADSASTPPATAAPVLPTMLPTPGTALTTGAHGVAEAPDDESAAILPAVPVESTAESTGSTNAEGKAASVIADAAGLTAAPGGSTSSTANATGAAAAATPVETTGVQPPPEPALNRALATSAAAHAGVTAAAAATARGASPATEAAPLVGTVDDDAETSAAPPRLAVDSSTLSGAVASGRPGIRTETDHPATPDTAMTSTDASPDAASTTLQAGTTSAPASVSAPTQAVSTGGELTPPPAVGSAAASTAAAPAAPPVAVSVARPVLLPQITVPVVSLAQAPDGDHSLTLTVSPENLGPVMVRAHISGGAIHIELHAPNELGREALRAILVDLRRDLAAAAPHASLLLSTSDDGPGSSNPQNSPNGGSAHGTATGTAGGQPQGGAAAGRGATGTHPGPDGDPPLPDGTAPAPFVSPHGGIEVFA